MQIFSIFSASGAANTHSHIQTRCRVVFVIKIQFIFAIDKRFVGVEAKIEAKMNCRIFDIFDLTEDSVFDIWFDVISDVIMRWDGFFM